MSSWPQVEVSTFVSNRVCDVFSFNSDPMQTPGRMVFEIVDFLGKVGRGREAKNIKES